jgi:hypothetical protein
VALEQGAGDHLVDGVIVNRQDLHRKIYLMVRFLMTSRAAPLCHCKRLCNSSNSRQGL